MFPNNAAPYERFDAQFCSRYRTANPKHGLGHKRLLHPSIVLCSWAAVHFPSSSEAHGYDLFKLLLQVHKTDKGLLSTVPALIRYQSRIVMTPIWPALDEIAFSALASTAI
jgi:hypothetical protein